MSSGWVWKSKYNKYDLENGRGGLGCSDSHTFCVSNAMYRQDCHGNTQKCHGLNRLEAKQGSEGDMELGNEIMGWEGREQMGSNSEKANMKYRIKEHWEVNHLSTGMGTPQTSGISVHGELRASTLKPNVLLKRSVSRIELSHRTYNIAIWKWV